jgi:protein-L-isoaspartate(D-aspartate) O-methyltransferase
MTDFATARARMVDNQLRTSTVTDHRLLSAMGEVPREAFVPAGRVALAYSDVVHPLGSGRYLAAPAPFAKLLQLAEIEHTDRILDVGAGTGYGTAVLARLGAEVTALESDAELAAKARAALAAAGAANATVVEGSLDGAGLEREFDVIIVEGAVRSEPSELFPLLAEGGRLVVLIGTGGSAVTHVFVRSGEEVAGRSEFNTSLPPLIATAPAETFEF